LETSHRPIQSTGVDWRRKLPIISVLITIYAGKGQIQAGDLVNFSVPTGNFGNIFGRVLCQADGVAGWAPDLCVDENNVVD